MKWQFFTLFSLIIKFSFQYGCTGHAIIWQIAYSQLNNQTQAWVMNLLNNTNDGFAKFSNIQEFACWADDIKNTTNDDWHYFAAPFFDGYQKTVKPKPQTIKTAVNASIYTLYNLTKNNSKSEMLRFLIHLYGDAHCPMHAISRYSPDQTYGDAGGNGFPLNDKSYYNLHSLWDSCLGYLSGYARPYTKTSVAKILNYSITFTRDYPKSQAFVDGELYKNFDTVLNDSYNIAKKYAYTGISPNSTIPLDYINSRVSICKKLITLGGYRLSEVIAKAYNPTSSFMQK